MKFILRLFKHLAILFLISLPLQCLGIFLLGIFLPIQALFFKNNPERCPAKLPYLLRWFDNADIYNQFNRDPITYIVQVFPKGWLYRFYWLALRNPCNYFAYSCLSLKPSKEIKTLAYRVVQGGRELGPTEALFKNIGDTTNAEPGLVMSEYLIDGIVRYEYYWIVKYSLNGAKCLRFRLGYKLGKPGNVQIGDYVQQVIVLSPYHSYDGR